MQDTEVPPVPSTEAAKGGEGAVGALLLKIQAGEGVQLSFEMRGRVLDSTPPSVIAVDDHGEGMNDDYNSVKMTEDINTVNISSAQGTLYFAEAHSETEMQEICRESEFERQVERSLDVE